MRLTPLAALACLPILLLAAQDPQDDDPDLRDPFTAFREDESARIEEAVQGAWMLMEYANPETLVDQEDLRGFLMFHDGYMSLCLQGREDMPGLFGIRREYTIQSGVYRYRIADGLHLQTAGMLGFTNANAEGEIDFRSVLEPDEYRITVTETELTLVREDHRSFRFRKLERTEFPASSIERLDRRRGGLPLDDDHGLGGGR